MPNRLIDETSPYLLQHAHNPVDWHPWGDEALARARDSDRPILLSIGYAACHWCHVMERESFEDPETAREMNEWFVPIKVDREERPDLDSVYMSAVQAMTGHGGWPMTVFLTPDGKPFFGGTYWPNEPRHGMPPFRQVLAAVRDAWENKRDGIEQQGAQLTEHIATASRLAASDEQLSNAVPLEAAGGMLEHLDGEWGGFGGAPKFPQPMTLEFLLRMHAHGDEDALRAVTLTLDRMARGGIFDQVGGGFHRYAVDRIWLVPHFEKMLYDNAQLLRLYARAWLVTRSELYRETALRTAEYLLREMRHPQGGFFSSQDADSEGVEGRFTVWPYEEIIALAGDDMPLAVAAYALSGTGNWEGVNVLWRPDPDEKVAEETGVTVAELRVALQRVQARLFEAREHRVRPATDDKVLAGWNGLAIAGLAEAGRIFRRPDLVGAAADAGRFVLGSMRRADGRLLRAWRDGRTGGEAFLEDHAMLADGLLTLYETTFERGWWDAAVSLADEMRALFADPNGGFFDTGSDVPQIVVRPKDLFDNATPSGNAAASDVLLRIAALAGDGAYAEAATGFLRIVQRAIPRSPLGFGQALGAIDRALSPGREIAVIGDPLEPGARALLDEVAGRFLPNAVVAAGPEGEAEPPLLRARTRVDGAPAAYVCERFVCARPVTSPAGLASLLGGGA